MPTPNTSQLLAFNVTRLRNARGFSQKELARRMKVAHTRVSEIENGHCGASGNTIDKLADALGVHISELLITEAEVIERARNPKNRLRERVTA